MWRVNRHAQLAACGNSLFVALRSVFYFLKFLCSQQTPVILRRLFGY